MFKFSIKQYLIIICVAFFIVGGIYLKWREYFLPMAIVKIAGQEIQVELAKTPKAQTNGLSGRSKLAANQGMLFLFPFAEKRSFWMKDMNFPIDIIWINNGEIVDIAPNLPPAIEANPPVYYPRLPVNAVLEVKAGFSVKNGLKIGDKVEMLTK
ncbi:MAG: DUF192 domain-containing protein [Candidatus Magasanikbacteria bacterium]|nr:DUF192 domain-containing protein [Candidatus Magasanikbacteria bacterium]